MTFYDVNDYLKASLFDDEAAYDRLPRPWKRQVRQDRHRRRGRAARRTDFARGMRAKFFDRGRSAPTLELATWRSVLDMMQPLEVISASVGDVSTQGVVVAVDYDAGRMWVRG